MATAGALVFLSPVAGSAQPSLDVSWQVRDSVSGLGSRHLALSPDASTVYVAGTDEGMTVITHDAATGEQLWRAGLSDGVAADVAASPDGTRVFVAGYLQETTLTFSFATVALDAATGDRLWGSVYSPGSDQSAGSNEMRVATDGVRVFVTGPIEGLSDTYWDFGTVAYDAATGDELWTARYPGAEGSNDIPYGGVKVAPDGSRVFVSGITGSLGCGDAVTVAYDATTGGELWTATDDTGGCDAAYAQAVSLDGAWVFVAGSNATQGLLVVYDANTGERVSEGLTAAPTGNAIAISPDGSRVFMTGSTTVAFGGALRAPRWSRSVAGFVGSAIAMTPDGTGLYVAGSLSNGRFCNEGDPSSDFGIVSFDAATGRPTTRARYAGLDAKSDDAATDASISPDGSSLYVSGNSDTCGRGSVATIAYAI